MSENRNSQNDGQNGGFGRDGNSRNGRDFQAKMVLPKGTTGGGFLRIRYRTSQEDSRDSRDSRDQWDHETVCFPRALVVVLLVLRQAFKADPQDSGSEVMRGWRDPKILARMIGDTTGFEPEPHAVQTNMVRIKRLMTAAAAAVREKRPNANFPGELIERRPYFGARLAFDFEIDDLTE